MAREGHFLTSSPFIHDPLKNLCLGQNGPFWGAITQILVILNFVQCTVYSRYKMKE